MASVETLERKPIRPPDDGVKLGGDSCVLPRRYKIALCLLAALPLVLWLEGDRIRYAFRPSKPSVMGSWGAVWYRTPDGPDSASIGGAVHAEFDGVGSFVARFDGDGAVHSVVGTWSRDDNPPSKDGDYFLVRIGMIDGKPLPANVKHESVSVHVKDGGLMFPIGVDAASWRFGGTRGALPRK